MSPKLIGRPLLPVVPLASLILAGACSTAGLPRGEAGATDGRLITAEHIERTGARNAWEALQGAHVHLGFDESRDGQPVSLSRRGRRSLLLRSEPLVVLNGARTEGVQLLHQIPASDIASIRVIGGIEATRRFGTGASAGAILIELKGGRAAGSR
jgi:hypothetical protein